MGYNIYIYISHFIAKYYDTFIFCKFITEIVELRLRFSAPDKKYSKWYLAQYVIFSDFDGLLFRI